MSEDLIERAASADKTLYVIDGANHMSLYDVAEYVDDAVSQLASFFQRTL
nr:alpha/beta hydrolase [Vibrio mimicus]